MANTYGSGAQGADSIGGHSLKHKANTMGTGPRVEQRVKVMCQCDACV